MGKKPATCSRPRVLSVYLGSRAELIHPEGQGEGGGSTEGAALRLGSSAHVHAPATPAKGAGL